MHAKQEYADALASETKGRQQAIAAVIEYGDALLEGRTMHKSDKDFGRWVSDNGLDQDKPWNDPRERSSAINIAKLAFGNSPESSFTNCPYTRPSDMMKWYRKKHPNPQAKAKRAEKAEAMAKGLEAIKVMEAKGETVTEDKIAAKAGIAAGTANKAFTVHKREKTAVEKAVAETTEKLSEDQQLEKAKFTAKGKLTIDKAIGIHRKRLDKSFWSTVHEEVRRQIDKADEAMRRHNAELMKENASLNQTLNQKALFTQAEFRVILMALHPDNSASADVRARAFDLVRKNEKRLVKSE